MTDTSKIAQETLEAIDGPMGKDLSEGDREHLEFTAANWAQTLYAENQSLALARECWINAFDAEAERLEGGSA